MRAGTLRHRLLLQNPSTAPASDGMGGFEYKYEDDREVFGAIWPVKGPELFRLGMEQSEIDCQIRIRYVDGVTPKTRIQMGDSTQYFDIVSVVNPDYRNRELILYCKTRQ